jgi:GDP-D-mannose 3',5'-epimerase
VNLGSSELVSIDEVVSTLERIAGVTLDRAYDRSAPTGVAARNSDNTLDKQGLGWAPSTTLDAGLAATYAWIEAQYRARQSARKPLHAGKR